MRRILFILFTSLLTAFFWTLSHAALDLELTQGMMSAIPIGMVFSGRSSGSSTVDLADVIKNDLQNSGQFRIVEGPTDSNWRQLGANDLLTGTVTQLSGNNYQVTVTLNNLFGANHANNIIFTQSFHVSENQLRSLAHHISDQVYQALTGVRGIFSTKIAYVLVQRASDLSAKYTLTVADADGFNPRPLLTSAEPIMSPTWSPDASQIAYVSFEGHRAAIYTQTVATGKRTLVSDAPGINGAPAFSPDGRQLALVLTKNGNPNIYLLNLNSGELHPITNDPYIDTEPAFSKDGQTLLFTSSRDGSPQIFSYALATGKIARVSYRGDYNARANFLPGVKSMVLMHRENGLFGIAKADLSNGEMQILTQSGLDESPSVAPNGKMILYATQYGNEGVLAIVSIDGRVKLRLPAREGSVQEPAWSPFINS